MATDANSKAIHALTNSGRVAYFLGLFALGYGYILGSRATFLFGVGLFLPPLGAFAATYFAFRRCKVEIQRRSVVRALEASPAELTIRSARTLRDVAVTEDHRPHALPIVFVDRVVAGAPSVHPFHEVYHRRGRVAGKQLYLSTSKPLGLARRVLPFTSGDSILVLPALGALGVSAERDPGEREFSESRSHFRRGTGSEIHQLREFVPGDQVKRIHWATTARTGFLIVREVEDEPEPMLVLRIVGDPRRGNMRSRRIFEASVSLAATMLHTWFRSGRPLCLRLPANGRVHVAPGDRQALLQAECALAELEASPEEDGAEELDATSPQEIYWIDSGSPRVTNPPPGVKVLRTESLLAAGIFRVATMARLL